MQGFIQDFFVRHTLNNNIIMYNHVLASQGGDVCVNWGGGERAVASPGGCMWIHMHPVHIPVQPLNYSFNVYQVLVVNSLYALFNCLVFTKHNHS